MIEEAKRRKELAKFLNRRLVEKFGRMSQTQIARMIGVSQSSLSQYVNGTRLPTGQNLHYLADAFGLEIYDICGVPRQMPNDERFKRIAEKWAYLPEDFQKKLADLAEDEFEMLKESDYGKFRNPELSGA